MTGHDDTALIRFVGSAFDDGHSGHETHHVLARGRQLRRRRHAMPALGALGGVAAAAGLAVALAGPGGAGGAGTALNVDNAAFSVHADTKTGKITVTIRQFSDENELKQILAKAGVPTVFASQHLSGSMSSCSWRGADSLPMEGVIQDMRGSGGHPAGASETMVIDPAKMPAGSVLALDYLTLDAGQIVTTTLLSGEPAGCGA